MARTVETDYLVVGAGAAGMAFADAVIDHDTDAHVLLVDRRTTPGGHWNDAYPFVRLHQASPFYGVASTLLGGGRVQESGPEAGLFERATGPQICTYYADVLAERMVPTGRAALLGGHEYVGSRVVDVATGDEVEVEVRRRVVDARYLAPSIPALTPPPFAVDDGVRVVAAGDVPAVVAAEGTGRYVVVGAGKTATDTVVWLLGHGVGPDDISWVRPREPWMLDRATVQPDPAVFLSMVAGLLGAAVGASSVDDLFLRLEDAGIMLRIDRAVTPTMGRVPTLGRWELDLLRAVTRVIRLGHLLRAARGHLVLADGDVDVPDDAVVVHCASYGLHLRPALPIWGDQITLQSVRAGFPPFSAALVGYVEATRHDRPDDEKNRLCPPTPYWSTPAQWIAMQARGARATRQYLSAPDIAAWASTVPLNPNRVGPDDADRPEVRAAAARLRSTQADGLAAMERLTAGVTVP